MMKMPAIGKENARPATGYPNFVRTCYIYNIECECLHNSRSIYIYNYMREANKISHVGWLGTIDAPQDEVLLVMVSNIHIISQNLRQDNDLLIILGWVGR